MSIDPYDHVICIKCYYRDLLVKNAKIRIFRSVWLHSVSLRSHQATSIVNITLPSLNSNQMTTIQFDTFATPLLQMFSAVTYMNLYLKIQIFMTSRLGLSLLFLFAKCLLFIFISKRWGHHLKFFLILWKCWVSYSQHFLFSFFSRPFLFLFLFSLFKSLGYDEHSESSSIFSKRSESLSVPTNGHCKHFLKMAPPPATCSF